MVILLLFLGIFLGGSFFSVDAGERAIIVTLWRVGDKSYTNGIYLKAPLISKVVKYDLRNEKVEVESSASSKDLQDINTSIAINYTLNGEDIPKIYTNIGTKNAIKDNVILPSIQEVVKSVFSEFTAEDLVKKRKEVSDKVKENLIKKTIWYSIKLLDVNIVNFQFSTAFNKAIEEKVTAEQEALAEKNRLEKIKFQAQQEIEKAKGEAEKIRISSEAIQKQGGKEYIQLQFIEKWDGVLPRVTSQGNILNLQDLL